MKTVRDGEGRRYLLVKRSGQSSRVRDPETGAERFLPNADLEVVDGDSPLETAARGVPRPVRRLVTAVHSEQALGLLAVIADDGPVPIRSLAGVSDLCESDLFGLVTEFRAAGLVREASIHGERGYDATDDAREALAVLRGASAGDGEGHAEARPEDPEVEP